MVSNNAPKSRSFVILAVVTSLATIGLIVFGAVVRVTDSGLGCGNHWPLCNGTIFPPLDNLTAWIEWLHRLFVVLIGLFGLGMLAIALRVYRKQDRRILIVTVIAAVLFVVQSGLGREIVLLDLPPTAVTLHLGNAMLLLGALLASAVMSIYRVEKSHPADGVTTLVYLTTALSLVIILTGALVRGSGATLACIDWPLCNGQIWPSGQGRLALIHMIHRAAVLGLGVALLLLVWQVWRGRSDKPVRYLAAAALVFYLAQAGIGALFVLSSAAPLWGAAHVGFASMTWALLVILSVIEWLNSRENKSEQLNPTWNPQSNLTQ